MEGMEQDVFISVQTGFILGETFNQPLFFFLTGTRCASFVLCHLFMMNCGNTHLTNQVNVKSVGISPAKFGEGGLRFVEAHTHALDFKISGARGRWWRMRMRRTPLRKLERHPFKGCV